MLAYFAASLPLLLTLAGLAVDGMTVRRAHEHLARLARDAIFLGTMERERQLVRLQVVSYVARAAPQVTCRVRVEEGHFVVVELERSVRPRFLRLLGLPAISIRASERRRSWSAWDWLHPDG